MYSQYLAAAIQCQSQISSIADKGSLLERYRLLLEELRLEAVRQTSRNRAPAPSAGAAMNEVGLQPTIAAVDGFVGQSDHMDFANHPSMHGSIDFGAAIPDQMSDYSGWDQFASMVSSGLGNLDAFLNDDPFGQFGDYGPVP